MKIDKIKKEISRIAKAKGRNKLLFTFKKEHFKSKLANSQGFGATDLKPTYFKVYKHLITKYGEKLRITCESRINMEVAVYLR